LDLALLIKKIVGYQGELKFDSSKPDGKPRKLMSIVKLKGLGWRFNIQLKNGLESVYNDYQLQIENI